MEWGGAYGSSKLTYPASVNEASYTGGGLPCTKWVSYFSTFCCLSPLPSISSRLDVTRTSDSVSHFPSFCNSQSFRYYRSTTPMAIRPLHTEPQASRLDCRSPPALAPNGLHYAHLESRYTPTPTPRLAKVLPHPLQPSISRSTAGLPIRTSVIISRPHEQVERPALTATVHRAQLIEIPHRRRHQLVGKPLADLVERPPTPLYTGTPLIEHIPDFKPFHSGQDSTGTGYIQSAMPPRYEGRDRAPVPGAAPIAQYENRARSWRPIALSPGDRAPGAVQPDAPWSPLPRPRVRRVPRWPPSPESTPSPFSRPSTPARLGVGSVSTYTTSSSVAPGASTPSSATPLSHSTFTSKFSPGRPSARLQRKRGNGTLRSPDADYGRLAFVPVIANASASARTTTAATSITPTTTATHTTTTNHPTSVVPGPRTLRCTLHSPPPLQLYPPLSSEEGNPQPAWQRWQLYWCRELEPVLESEQPPEYEERDPICGLRERRGSGESARTWESWVTAAEDNAGEEEGEDDKAGDWSIGCSCSGDEADADVGR